jgi:hypothetical protein
VAGGRENASSQCTSGSCSFGRSEPQILARNPLVWVPVRLRNARTSRWTALLMEEHRSRVPYRLAPASARTRRAGTVDDEQTSRSRYGSRPTRATAIARGRTKVDLYSCEAEIRWPQYSKADPDAPGSATASPATRNAIRPASGRHRSQRTIPRYQRGRSTEAAVCVEGAQDTEPGGGQTTSCPHPWD